MENLVKQILKELKEQYGELPTGGLEGTADMSSTHKQIIDFFKSKNTAPTDEEVHKMAEGLGMDADDFESHIYMILFNKIKKAPGKHTDVPDSEFNPGQLKMGQQVELEHTDCPIMAKEIAKDHLVECPDYYTRLLKMEKECEKK